MFAPNTSQDTTNYAALEQLERVAGAQQASFVRQCYAQSKEAYRRHIDTMERIASMFSAWKQHSGTVDRELLSQRPNLEREILATTVDVEALLLVLQELEPERVRNIAMELQNVT